MGPGHPPERFPRSIARGPAASAATAAGLVHGARVLLGVSARRPAVWLAAAAAAPGVGGLAAAASADRALLLGAATTVGGLAGAAAIGAAAGPAWIGARVLWPALGILLGGQVGGLLGGPMSVTVAAGVGLATVTALAIGLRRCTTEAADSVSGTLVGAGLAALAAGGCGLLGGDDRQALAAAGAVGGALGALVAVGRAWLEPLFEPAPWDAQRRRQLPWPTESRLRQHLLLAAMVSSLVAMVVGLFLVPAAAGLVGVIGCGWLITLSLPPACLGHGGSTDRRWCWLERCAVGPERPGRRGPAGHRHAAGGVSRIGGGERDSADSPWPKSIHEVQQAVPPQPANAPSHTGGQPAWKDVVQGLLASSVRSLITPRGPVPAGGGLPRRAAGGVITALWGVAWHAAVIGWPSCVAVALSAGDLPRLRGAGGAIGAVAGVTLVVMLATVWSRWPSRGGHEPGDGETGHAVGVTLAAWALVAALAWR